jgi:hypothetical protein
MPLIFTPCPAPPEAAANPEAQYEVTTTVPQWYIYRFTRGALVDSQSVPEGKKGCQGERKVPPKKSI